MTPREAKALRGQTGRLRFPQRSGYGALAIDVKILDTRESFGRVDLLVTPVSGSGQQWAQAVNVKVNRGAK